MTPDKMPKKKGHRAKGYKKIPIIVTTDGGDPAEPSLVAADTRRVEAEV